MMIMEDKAIRNSLIVTAMVLVALGFALGVGNQSPIPATSLQCNSPGNRDYIFRMIWSMKWPLGSENIKLFDVYNMRPNPAFGMQQSAVAQLVDVSNPCKATILTDRGDFGFTFGWKTVNNKTYILGQLGDPSDDITP
jgi:hypothetical protein